MSNITVKKIHCSVFSIFGIIDFHNTRIFSGILIEICPFLLVIILEVKIFQNNRYRIERGVNHALFGMIEKLKYQKVSHPLLIFPSSSTLLNLSIPRNHQFLYNFSNFTYYRSNCTKIKEKEN